MFNTGTYNITCYQGATYSETFTIKINDVAVNLTGYTAAMQVRRSHEDTTAILTLTSGSGITLGGAAGTITLTIAYADTEDLIAGQYLYDLEITSSGGTKDRLLQGTFTVSSEITRV